MSYGPRLTRDRPYRGGRGAGDNVVEHVAGVDDFETAVATLLGRRPTMAKGEDHAAPGSTGGGEELAGSSLTKSIISAPRREHSHKPDEGYEMIEHMYPELPKIELFARQTRVGWDAWGNEVAREAAE